MATTTNPTALTGRIIPTRYPDKACVFCTATPTAWAYNGEGTWQSACDVCADSYQAQVLGLRERMVAAFGALSEAEQAGAQALVAPLTSLMAEVLANPSHPQAAALVTSLRAACAAMVPAPVRANSYAGTCATCHGHVAIGAGRIVRELGKWATYHLAGECPQVAAADAPAAPAAAGPAPVGLHLLAGKVVKVYLTQNNRLAGKVLQGHSFTYQRGATAGLSAATLMTAEQARAFGRETGTCCNCGEEIGHGDTSSTLQSLAQGYGPVCARRNGWPTLSVTEAVATLRAEGIDHPLLHTDECTEGQTCHHDSLCSKHSAEYQRRHGRAANE